MNATTNQKKKKQKICTQNEAEQSNERKKLEAKKLNVELFSSRMHQTTHVRARHSAGDGDGSDSLINLCM